MKRICSVPKKLFPFTVALLFFLAAAPAAAALPNGFALTCHAEQAQSNVASIALYRKESSKGTSCLIRCGHFTRFCSNSELSGVRSKTNTPHSWITR
jgi:hypothetical protein